MPLPKRTRHARKVRVVRTIDLSELEDGPTPRADPGLLRFGADIRPLRGQARIWIETPAESRQGTAMTAVILLGAGALLGIGGFAVGSLCRFPSFCSVIAAALLLVAPVITYIWLNDGGN
jgi:hypothetical protein